MKRLIVLLSLLFSTAAAAGDRIIVLDVGEGLSVLLKHHSQGILIDTGRPGMTVRILNRLEAHGITSLSYIFLTHLHSDHAGGYFRLREAFPKTPILYSGHPFPEESFPDLVRWVKRSLEQDPSTRIVRAGDRLDWQGFRIEILWPDRFRGPNLNRHSLVIRINFKKTTALVMGDADRHVERQLARSGVLKKVQLLVAGHHGASDTGDIDFLGQTRPDHTVISVNRNNHRGYPSAATVKKLQDFSGSVLRTDRDGEVRFRLVNMSLLTGTDPERN